MISFKQYLLLEGPRDPQTFKVIFMAGTPGSGKSTISKQIVAGSALKVIDIDCILEYFAARDNKPATYDDESYIYAKDKVLKCQNMYLDGRLGMLIDTTASNYERIVYIADNFKKFGYEVMMVFVNTDLETALDRVHKRNARTSVIKTKTDNGIVSREIAGRVVPDEIVVKYWNSLQKNLGLFQQYFGNENFIIIDNTNIAPKEQLDMVWKKVKKFLDSPPRTQIARTWLNSKV